MSGNNYLLDTNIVLFLLSGDSVLADIIGKNPPYISFITEMELLSYRKLSSADEIRISEFLKACLIVEMNAPIKMLAIKMRKVYGLK